MAQILYTRAPSSPSYIGMSGRRPFYSPVIPKRPIGAFGGSPELEGRRASLGAGGVNIDSVTVIAALGGGIAVLASKSFPEPGPIIAKVLGYGAMGFAVYRAFFEGEAAQAAVDQNSPGSPVVRPPAAIASPTAFEKVSGTFISPIDGQTVERGFFGSSYPVRIMLSNGDPTKKVDVIYQVLAKETPSYLWGLSIGEGAPNIGQPAQGQVTLQPMDSHPIDLSMKTATSFPGLADKVKVELTLQKKRSAETPWETLSTVTFY